MHGETVKKKTFLLSASQYVLRDVSPFRSTTVACGKRSMISISYFYSIRLSIVIYLFINSHIFVYPQSYICLSIVMYSFIHSHIFVYQQPYIRLSIVIYLFIHSHIFVYPQSYICLSIVIYLFIHSHIFVYPQSYICLSIVIYLFYIQQYLLRKVRRRAQNVQGCKCVVKLWYSSCGT